MVHKPRWSDVVEEGPRSKLLDLPDSLMVTKTRGISHPHAAIEGQTEKPTMSSSGNDGLGPFDVGDRAIVESGYRSNDDRNPNIADVDLTHILPAGADGNTQRGGFQARGRGATARGMYRQEPRSWANVASASVRSEVKLQYFPPKVDNDKIVVKMPPVSLLAKWEACLVGYFIDKRLPYTLIKNSAFNMWHNKGLLEVNMNDEGFTLFIFENKDCCKDILDGGPWYVGGFLLILKQWHRMMKLSKEGKKTIPVWVKFYNIPMEFWNGDGLSRIASAVGVPLFMDQLTSSGNIISFARVCVDIHS
ncbi:hypothetical protein CsSME_00045439 [Camellia sinensis var. sinensis]